MANLTLNSGQINDLVGVRPALMVIQNTDGSFKAAESDDFDSATNGELSTYRNINLGTGGANIKSSVGAVYGYYLFNQGSILQYVKFYDVTGVPTVGTNTPALTLTLPSSGGANANFDGGIKFISGIGIGATTGIADANVGSPAANDITVNVFYK